MRESMVFYRGWIEAIKNLSEEVQREVLMAIIGYGLNGETVELIAPITKAMFEMAKPQIDLNNNRYENSKKGGRPSVAKKPKKNHRLSNPKPNDNANVNDNDNANANVIFSNSNELLCGTTFHDATSINYKNIIEVFNRETNGYFGVVKYPISEQRKGMLRARIREYGPDTLIEVFQKAMKSGFLKGDSGRFKATFDWLIRPTNFEKVLTGNYDERNETPNENKVNW